MTFGITLGGHCGGSYTFVFNKGDGTSCSYNAGNFGTGSNTISCSSDVWTLVLGEFSEFASISFTASNVNGCPPSSVSDWTRGNDTCASQEQPTAITSISTTGGSSVTIQEVPETVTGMIGWYDATKISGLSNGNNVSTWNDARGSSFGSATSSFTAPTFVTNSINGRSTVRLTDGSRCGMATSVTLSSRPYTVLHVFTRRFGEGRTLQGSGSNNWLLGNSANTVGHFANNWVSPSNNVSVIDRVYISTSVSESSKTRYFQDGQQLTNSDTPTGNPGVLHFGSSGAYDERVRADLCETIIYDSALSNSDREKVEKYLREKWQEINLTTQGGWCEGYGTEGHWIHDGGSNGGTTLKSLPSYATVTVTGASNQTWAANSNDPRAMVKNINTTFGTNSRISACWFSSSSMTINIIITGSVTRTVALYMIDWDSTVRDGTVTLTKTSDGRVLHNAIRIIDYANGRWIVFNVLGDVTLTFSASVSNIVVSGIFFGRNDVFRRRIGIV